MALVGVVTTAALAIVATAIKWLPRSAATQADRIDHVYWAVTIICIGIFAVVAGVSVYAVWKFRAPPDDWEDGSPIHGHTGLEKVWTAVPLALVIFISVYSSYELSKAEDVPLDHPKVEVSSQQFAWSFSYPAIGPDVSSGELVLPVGRTTELDLTAKDVIHSFWVREWRVKQDAVPGIHTHIVITPTKVGTYEIICTELCGLGHAAMRSQARVLSRQDYANWVAAQKKGAQPAASTGGGKPDGKAIFTSSAAGCGNCHTLADAATKGRVGPDLGKVLGGKSADFIHESIVDPNAEIAAGYQPNVMPQNFEQKLSKEQIDALVAYLLKATKP
jgi:cytochrome c oxidase subunit 2